MKRVLLSLVLICVFLLTAACSDQSFDDLDLTTYESRWGYTLSIPTDWEITEDGDASCTFTNAAGDIILATDVAAGTMEYQTLEELCDELRTQMLDTLFETIETSKERGTENAYRILLSGTDAQGTEVTVDVMIYSPFTSVHYYFTVTAQAEQYEKNSYIIDGIFDSLTVTKTEDEIYAQIRADRTEQEEAILEELSNSEEEDNQETE